MNFFISFGEIYPKAKSTFKQYPIALLWAILGTLFALYISEIESNNYINIKIIITFILGISWLIATHFLESLFKSNKKWLFLITLGLLALFYWQLPNRDNKADIIFTLRFALYFFSGHLFILSAPFLKNWNKETYSNYISTVFVSIIKSLFFSIIIYLGIVLALLAVKHLFNIDFDGKIFFQIFIICIGTINSWIFLSDIPENIYNDKNIYFSRALEVLVKYILIPLVILYVVILYAYSLKIIINWSLPKGWVSYLVIALSFLGFLVQIIINPIQKISNSKTIKLFYPWFYYSLLPLLFLLFIAIFRRINEYGITENRYLVFVIALWIFGVTFYMLISKQKKIIIFPKSLTILALLISFGFWGIFSVSTKSQINQFKKVYNDIKSTNFTTTLKKKNQLNSILKYLSQKDELHLVESVIGYNPKTTFKTSNNYQLQNKLIDSLNIKTTDIKKNSRNYFTINEEDLTINIANFDLFKRLYLSTYNKGRTIASYKLAIQKDSNIITVLKNNTSIGNIDCTDMISYVKKNTNGNNVHQKFMTLEKDFKQVKMKIIFQTISLHNFEKNNNLFLNSANTYVLIKEKNNAE